MARREVEELVREPVKGAARGEFGSGGGLECPQPPVGRDERRKQQGKDYGRMGGRGRLEYWEGEEGWTWEREREGRMQRSRIDLFLSKGEKDWGEVRKEKLASDHWALVAEMDWGEEGMSIERKAVDWACLEKELEGLKDKGLEEEKRWYETLAGLHLTRNLRVSARDMTRF
ncbi:hypothetical protein L211DRAFT_854560 [Terfezia boudieri ATCC MYA-4762]|uniref:Endonuclease/exonuclease/phosphatase domain-containing protein n=1 Tax=Terfezia boudieri ATCC MYA-4762 TaxID=1051890 RepID=A0A3N4L8D5_9PEZI|nr:hypothetical protein L211DRAFT_854560 [Terfezia boudieri ATCC MYA-4762]